MGMVIPKRDLLVKIAGMIGKKDHVYIFEEKCQCFSIGIVVKLMINMKFVVHYGTFTFKSLLMKNFAKIA